MAEAPQQYMSGARRLRQMLADPKKTIVAPGVYDGITARLAVASGAECLYMTGAGTSMSHNGLADLGITTFTDMSSRAATLASLSPCTPLIADADTGYGGPIAVAHTVRTYARAGVAGLHIEDQVQEKRCGHLAGKQVVQREVFYRRLRAACKAREEVDGGRGEGIVVIARTDARAGVDPEGRGGLGEAVERLRGAVECGVDAVFLEALQSVDEMREAVKALPEGVPVLLNMVQGGKTPLVSGREAGELGFRIVIWPTMGMEAVVPAYRRALETLHETGKAPEEGALGPTALFETCGLRELMAFDESVGGSAYK